MFKYRQLCIALAALVAAAMLLAAPAAAQFSDSYKFLEAVRKKDGTVVTELLEKGSPSLINTRDQTSGQTGLHIATQRRDLVWMQYMISRGANVNIRDGKGQTPLVIATNFGFVEGVELLVSAGAKVDESSTTGETPLITAVHNRNIGLMRLLLKAGADPDRADNSGRSARDYAKLDAKSAVLLSEINANAKPKPKPGQGPQVFGPK